jgi:hypothetical protein
MTTTWADALTAVSTFLAATATGGAWMAARRSNATADSMAKIERDRWHADLTPQFDIDLREGLSQAKVHIYLNGPDILGHLDEVTLTVEDDDMDHTLRTPEPGLTQEKIDAHVWGPFRFTPSGNQGDANGRTVGPFHIQVGRGRPLSMERTMPGFWMEGTTRDRWQENYAGQPIRLRIVCRRGDEEWVIARRLENPPIAAVGQ